MKEEDSPLKMTLEGWGEVRREEGEEKCFFYLFNRNGFWRVLAQGEVKHLLATLHAPSHVRECQRRPRDLECRWRGQEASVRASMRV